MAHDDVGAISSPNSAVTAPRAAPFVLSARIHSVWIHSEVSGTVECVMRVIDIGDGYNSK